MSSQVVMNVVTAQPDERNNLEMMVYTHIKRAILSRELKPGEKISFTDWVERLKVSRTPVRDALKRLETEGFIIRETERMWHVYTLTIEEVNRIFDGREAVDAKIAYLAAKNMTDEKRARLVALTAEMERTRSTNDYETFYHFNGRFHELLNQMAENKYLADSSRWLNDMLSRLYPKGINIDGRLEDSLNENRQIIEALLAEDGPAAEAAQIRHLRSYRKHLLMVLKEMVIPFTGPVF